jgi:hypothetical protein
MSELRRHLTRVLIHDEKVRVREVQGDLVRAPEGRHVGWALTQVLRDDELSSAEQNQDCSFSVFDSVTGFLPVHEHHVFSDVFSHCRVPLLLDLGTPAASTLLPAFAAASCLPIDRLRVSDPP